MVFRLNKVLFALLLFAASTLSAQQDTLWTKTFGGSGDDFSNSVQETSDGGFIIAGFTTSFGAGSYDVYLIRLSSAQEIKANRNFPVEYTLSTPCISGNLLVLRFGIPKRGDVSFRIYNITGRNIFSVNRRNLEKGYHTVKIPLEHISQGIYFIEMQARRAKLAKRVILVK